MASPSPTSRSPWRLFVSYLILLLVIMTCQADGKAARRKKAANAHHASISSFITVIKWTVILSLAPILIFFIYTVVTDPDLPRILRHLWQTGKKKWLSYLGKKQPMAVVDPGFEDEDEEPELPDYLLVHPLRTNPEPKKVR